MEGSSVMSDSKLIKKMKKLLAMAEGKANDPDGYKAGVATGDKIQLSRELKQQNSRPQLENKNA